ncbi:hypothetical protein GCM10022221_00780 [Actinocorallia aurea]
MSCRLPVIFGRAGSRPENFYPYQFTVTESGARLINRENDFRVPPADDPRWHTPTAIQ